MLNQSTQKEIRNELFETMTEVNGEMFGRHGFEIEGQGTGGLLLYNSEQDQWLELRLVFKKDTFDGIEEIAEQAEKVRKAEEQKAKKEEKVKTALAKKEKAKKEEESTEE